MGMSYETSVDARQGVYLRARKQKYCSADLTRILKNALHIERSAHQNLSSMVS